MFWVAVFIAPSLERCYYTPASTKLIRGYTGITLSVCPSVRPSVCPSVDRIVSALYLQQYSSDPFYICTSYQATSEGVSRVMPVSKLKNLKFWRIFKIYNFDFVIFWLGIQYDSMVWVIMRQRGYPQNAGVLVVLVMVCPTLYQDRQPETRWYRKNALFCQEIYQHEAVLWMVSRQ